MTYFTHMFCGLVGFAAGYLLAAWRYCPVDAEGYEPHDLGEYD